MEDVPTIFDYHDSKLSVNYGFTWDLPCLRLFEAVSIFSQITLQNAFGFFGSLGDGPHAFFAASQEGCGEALLKFQGHRCGRDGSTAVVTAEG